MEAKQRPLRNRQLGRGRKRQKKNRGGRGEKGSFLETRKRGKDSEGKEEKTGRGRGNTSI